MDNVSHEQDASPSASLRSAAGPGGDDSQSRGVQQRRQTRVVQGGSFGQTVEDSIKAAVLLEETNAQPKDPL